MKVLSRPPALPTQQHHSTGQSPEAPPIDAMQPPIATPPGAPAPYAPLLEMPVRFRQPAVGAPQRRVTIDNGTFANSCFLWNPTAWLSATVCFGSWGLCLPCQSCN